MTNLDPAIVKHQLENLKVSHPELIEDEEAWLLSLESETNFKDAMEKIEEARQDAAAMAGAIATRIAELELRQARFERKEQAMRKLAFGLMKAAGVPKVTLPTATLSVRNGGNRLVIPDESAVPEEFCRFKREVDRTAIKKALETVTFNWAALEQSPESLAVRTK